MRFKLNWMIAVITVLMSIPTPTLARTDAEAAEGDTPTAEETERANRERRKRELTAELNALIGEVGSATSEDQKRQLKARIEAKMAELSAILKGELAGDPAYQALLAAQDALTRLQGVARRTPEDEGRRRRNDDDDDDDDDNDNPPREEVAAIPPAADPGATGTGSTATTPNGNVTAQVGLALAGAKFDFPKPAEAMEEKKADGKAKAREEAPASLAGANRPGLGNLEVQRYDVSAGFQRLPSRQSGASVAVKRFIGGQKGTVARAPLKRSGASKLLLAGGSRRPGTLGFAAPRTMHKPRIATGSVSSSRFVSAAIAKKGRGAVPLMPPPERSLAFIPPPEESPGEDTDREPPLSGGHKNP